MGEVFSCAFRKRDAYDQMPALHSHEGLCELYYLASGERRYFIQDSVVPVHAGGFVFIKPSILHKTSFLGPSSHSRYHASVPQSWLENLLPSLPVFYIINGCEELEVFFSQLLLESDNPDIFAQEHCRCLVLEIVIRTYRRYQEESRSTDDFTDTVASYVKNHISGRITLDDVSSAVSLSPCYFSAVFHERTGMRFSDYLTSMRVSAAAQALKSGCKVQEAALMSGFSNAGYFKDVFRKVMKISPSAYRKAFHKT